MGGELRAMGSLPFGVQAFEYLREAVIVVDENLNVIFLNTFASQLYEVSQEKVLCQKIVDIFIEEWLTPKDSQGSIDSLNKKGFWSGEYYHIKKNGQRFSVLVSITTINDPSGVTRGQIYVIHPLYRAKFARDIDDVNTSGQQLDSVASDSDIGVHNLANLIDADALQSMMDDLYAVTKIGFAVIDLKGNVLAATGWQDICTKFHRTNPQTLWNCLESDIVLTQGVVQGEFKTYKCKNNMWDIVTPIVIGKNHVGNLFSGQFFFDDETIDKDQFAAQAERFGFDKVAYLTALDNVPRWNRAVVRNLMQFYVKLSEMISKLSYSNFKLSKSLSTQRLIEQQLRLSHHDLKHAQEVAKTGSWRLNVQTNELTWSDETYRMFGVPSSGHLTYERFLEFVHTDDRELVTQSWNAALRGAIYDLEHRIIVNKTVFWVHEKAELEFAEDGTLVGGFGTVQDITEHKLDQQKLRRLNRALRAISNSNQVLMRATDETAFLQQGCRIIVEDCGYALVWIGFAVEDAAKTVKPMAYAGLDKGYIDSLNITWADTERGQGPTGWAIRTGQPQICANMSCDLNFAPWRKQALDRGYVSSIVLPLIFEGKTFGALNIYSPEPNPFSTEEVKLLAELASDFAHGIMMLRIRAAAKKAEEAWRLSEEKFSKAFDQSPAAMSITRLLDGRYVEVNQTFLDLLGYSRQEVINHTSPELNIFANPFTAGEFIEIFRGKSIHNVEMTFRTKTGELLRTIVSIEKISINNQDHIITTFVDISRRKKAEEQLSRAKAEWEQTFDALPELIAIMDDKHRILRVNKAMAQTLGLKAEQCIGLPCYECVHLTNVPPDMCPHTQTMNDGEEHIVQLYEERLGGDIIVSTTPLKDKDGKTFASVHVVRSAKRFNLSK